MLIIKQFPKHIVGRTKCPRGTHAALVFETPDLNVFTSMYKIIWSIVN